MASAAAGGATTIASGTAGRRWTLRRLLPRVLGLAAAGTAAGVWWWAQPSYRSVATPHDDITREQCAALRHVRSGEAVNPDLNPGVRVFANFLPEEELQRLRQELQPLKQRYGISLIQPVHAALYRWQMSYLRKAPPVNMMRVTGRPEQPSQVMPPWGYGDGFDEDKMPPLLRATAARIRALPGVRLGRLRDVTINYRHSGFLRLDPHVDPAADGPNIFILSVDSDTVLTLCPANYLRATQALQEAWGLLTLADERDVVRQRAAESWTSKDIDALLARGSLVHLAGNARWTWTHGTRLGVEAEGAELLQDWFGKPGWLVARGPERHSVVFAFDDA